MNSIDGDDARLSFSDLQLSGDDDLQMDSNACSVDENQDQDFLGFCSEEWPASTTTASSDAQEDIIFCGKIISNVKPKPKNSIPRWNSDSFSSSSNGRFSSSNRRSNSLPISGRKKDDDDDCNNKLTNNDVVGQKTTKLTCPSKSGWRVFMFGSGKFPVKMELSDIRSRQLRRSPVVVVGEEEKGRGNRFSGMIRLLGCGGGFNDYVPFC